MGCAETEEKRGKCMTIKDIARLSGYGIGTVSRVLNNHSDVSDKARKKIMEVIEESNFQPNTNARHLKRQSASSLSIIVKGNQNMLFADILEKMQMLFSRNGENAEVSYIDEDANEVECALSLCRDRNPKGIIFLGGNLDYFDAFDSIEVPCVLLTNSAGSLNISNLSSFYTDDEEASYQVGSYLIKQGHKKIGVIGGTLSATQISSSRYEGCLRSFKENGIDFEEKKAYISCRYSMEDGYQAAKKLLKQVSGVTAIIALSDTIAVGAMRAICDAGKRVPDDISVVGFDGISLSNYCIPRLTTIRQDTDRMAREGVELMLRQIHYPGEGRDVSVPFQLLERESVRKI